MLQPAQVRVLGRDLDRAQGGLDRLDGRRGLGQGSRGRVVLLDWGMIGTGPPGVELAWYLAVNSARLPVAKEAAIGKYRRTRARRLGARFDERWWRPQLDLSLLGGFLQLGWAKAVGAVRGEDEAVRARERAEVLWWSQWVDRAARWL